MADSEEPTAPSLERLPDEILLHIADNLETARDMRSLALTSKKLQHCVDSSTAWQDFVRSKFPFTDIPPQSGKRNWKALADSLTYQSRCWDRRSIRFTGMLSSRAPPRRGMAFQPVIDVDFDFNLHREIVVWGAGEDIVVRYREQTGGTQAQQSNSSWRRLLGAEQGLRPGPDDISTIDIVKLSHLTGPAILAGRQNGNLSLLSAGSPASFGQHLANLDPSHASVPIKGAAGARRLTQNSIMSVDVLNDNNQGLVAACTNLGVPIFRLPTDNDTTAIPPIELYDVSADTAEKVCNAKWMGGTDLLALAFRGDNDPLRYLAVTPTGWRVEAAAKNARVIEQFELRAKVSILPSSLQPVRRYPGMTGPTPLLLSSWRDTTVRLQDIRTPSPFDVVYQDNVQPTSEMGNLLIYGADRFIAGDMQGVGIKIFDFRWPKAYYHTTGLPCGSEHPFRSVEQRFIPPPVDKTLGRACCDHLQGLRCRWHELSREVYYRPNALVMLSESLRDCMRWAGPRRVTSLAKASDVSPNFYIGVGGAVIEANLGPISTEVFDTNLGFPDPTPDSRSQSNGYNYLPLPAMMMEVGDGLRSQRNDDTIRLPRVHSRERIETSLNEVDPMLRARHRLDESFQDIQDFGKPVE